MKKGMIFMGLWLLGCTKESTRDFYFPLKQLKDGLVYVYEMDGNGQMGEVYWYYRSIVEKEVVRMTSTYYENNPAPVQISREVMTIEGMVQESLNFYETGQDGKSEIKEVEIKKGLVFSFDEVDNKKCVHQVKWKEEDGEIEVIKKRRVIGRMRYDWEGREIESIEIEVNQQVLHHADGTLELNSRGREIYAKGLGLVYYEVIPQEGIKWAYRLKERISMEELGRRLLTE
jgi:hypothetical protein